MIFVLDLGPLGNQTQRNRRSSDGRCVSPTYKLLGLVPQDTSQCKHVQARYPCVIPYFGCALKCGGFCCLLMRRGSARKSLPKLKVRGRSVFCKTRFSLTDAFQKPLAVRSNSERPDPVNENCTVSFTYHTLPDLRKHDQNY